MDRNTFDGIARLFAGAGTRRGALGALFGATALGLGLERDAAAKRRRRGRKRRRRNKRKGPCFGSRTCAAPEPGHDFDNCDYADTTIFVDANAGGSSFRRVNLARAIMDGANLQGTLFKDANLKGASMVGVDVRGASFPGACLLDADLTGHIFADGEEPFKFSFACNTRVAPDFVVDRDCGKLPRCCRR